MSLRAVFGELLSSFITRRFFSSTRKSVLINLEEETLNPNEGDRVLTGPNKGGQECRPDNLDSSTFHFLREVARANSHVM